MNYSQRTFYAFLKLITLSLSVLPQVLFEKTQTTASERGNTHKGEKGKLIKVNFDNILFIEGAGNYVKIWLNNQDKIMTLLTFKALEELLPKEHFIRVNKSYIVAFQLITGIEGNMVRLGDLTFTIGGTYNETVTKLFVEKVS